MAKEKLPFELDRPNPSTPVADASTIRYGSGSVKDKLDKMGGETLSKHQKSLYITDALGNVLGEFNEDGLSVTDIKLPQSGILVSIVNLLSLKVDKITGKGLSSNDYTNSDKAKLETFSYRGESLYITDSNGYVVAKIGKDGLSALSLNIIDDGVMKNIRAFIDDALDGKVDKITGKGLSSNDYTNDDKAVVASIINKYTARFVICDNNGYVGFSIDNRGVNYIGKGSSAIITELDERLTDVENKLMPSSLYGKNVYVIGDSLSTSGVWMERLAELTGALFDNSVNTNPEHPISVGGTKTLDLSGNCGMDRARNLYAVAPNADVIIIENINDRTQVINNGAITDIPFMLLNTAETQTTYNTKSSAIAALDSEIANITPSVGTMIKIPYSSHAYSMVLSGNISSAGQINISIDGNDFGVEVLSNDTIASIQNKIIEWDFSSVGYSDTKINDNGVLFTDTQDRATPPVITANNGNTGVVINITATDSVDYIGYCFMSKDVAEWNTAAKWVEWNTVTLYSIYMGLLEYLFTNFPSAKIFFMLTPRTPYLTRYATRPDGTYDYNAWFRAQADEALSGLQKVVADYMLTPTLDVRKECGINTFNAHLYMASESNVHFNTNGYKLLGETVARLIN